MVWFLEGFVLPNMIVKTNPSRAGSGETGMLGSVFTIPLGKVMGGFGEEGDGVREGGRVPSPFLAY